MTIRNNNAITNISIVYDLLVDHVDFEGASAHGLFGGGPKRDVVIENSTWEFGEGDETWNGTDEFDQSTGVAFIHDHITGLAVRGAEGPSMAARIYLTEGTSNIYFLDNTFNHVLILTDSSTDDYVENNTFKDSTVLIGNAYVPNIYPHDQGLDHHTGFLSFGPQTTAVVSGNQFDLDADFLPPYVVYVGHYQNASVTNNIFNLAGEIGGGAVIMSYGGDIRNNTINVKVGMPWTIGILAIPDFGPGVPFASFDIENNTITTDYAQGGIGVVGPDIVDPEPLCIKNNVIHLGRGPDLYTWNSKNIQLACPAQ